ncbi:hypothetical protein FQR65_LT13255 [Abscondita terminalis]|nr:hypothetical protein FQR65_LT13255 [Abscondita terminalis]
MSTIYVLIILCALFYYLYSKLKEKNTYWTKKNVPQSKPFPFVGNFGPLLLQIKSKCDLIQTMYNEFPNARYFGMYQFLRPTLVLKDLDLIKRITVRDFDVFPEHSTIVPEEVDPLFARNILFMKGGDKWQRLRSMLSPAFTSSKMKSMYPLMVKCAQQLVEHFEKIDGVSEMEIKEMFSRFTNDVIATTAFGVECNSFANPDDTFYTMGKRSLSISFINVLKTFMYSISPFIMSFFKMALFPKEASDFFRKLVKDAMVMREEKGIVRLDMLHLLNEARKGRMKYDEQENNSDTSFAVVEESDIGKKQMFKYSDISDDDLIAQAVVFFLAGFDTSSTALSFCAYELAINPDVQEKLRNEIDTALSTTNENFLSYEQLLNMKYLDMVFTESLRMWPPLVMFDRRSVKPFTLESKNPGEETIHFEKGTVCVIPVHSIQRDPKYYPNPDKFDPERFNEANKHSLTPTSFLTFGMGPKNCIGSRFALLEAKLIFCAILSKFEFVPVSKTHIPMEKNAYWTKKNVLQSKPSLLVGNFGPLIFRKQPMCDLLQNMYNEFPHARYFGMYEFLKPNLVIKDLDLIKRITVKEFDVFPEHSTVVPEEIDPLFARNILFMRGGDKWQRLRSMLSPTFTSSKMKSMYPLLIKCAQQFVNHYETFNDVPEFEAKETFSRYTSDIIATSAFGVECNSFANPNDTFYLMGKKSVALSVLDILKSSMYSLFPFIMKFFSVTIIPKDASDFFRKVITDAMVTREEKNIVRPDMLHLLNEARKGRMKYDEQENKSGLSFAEVEESDIGKKQTFKYSDITDEDLIAQAVMFFLAGFETSSAALTFCTYELAIDPDVQQKLRSEIDDAFSATDKTFVSYEQLLSMKYLDKVLTESLRKWPPLVMTDRNSVKPFSLESKLPGEETIHFEKGTVCIVPVYAIQRDPKYFPNPDKFDPDRFNENNKNFLPFLSFGMGPKNCIGARLALLEIKILLCALLRAFEIVPVSKTQIPVVINRNPIFLGTDGGLWLGLKKRNI